MTLQVVLEWEVRSLYFITSNQSFQLKNTMGRDAVVSCVCELMLLITLRCVTSGQSCGQNCISGLSSTEHLRNTDY